MSFCNCSRLSSSFYLYLETNPTPIVGLLAYVPGSNSIKCTSSVEIASLPSNIFGRLKSSTDKQGSFVKFSNTLDIFSIHPFLRVFYYLVHVVNYYRYGIGMFFEDEDEYLDWYKLTRESYLQKLQKTIIKTKNLIVIHHRFTKN